MLSSAFHLVILAVMLLGLIGVIIPVLPGLTIIWAAALVYGLVDGFTWQSGVLFGGMTLLMLAGNLLDNLIIGAGARKEGASWGSLAVALVLGIAGSLIFPPFGGLIAALLGIFGFEFYRLRDWRKAAQSTRGLATGCGWSALTRGAIAALMIGMWLLWVFVL